VLFGIAAPVEWHGMVWYIMNQGSFIRENHSCWRHRKIGDFDRLLHVFFFNDEYPKFSHLNALIQEALIKNRSASRNALRKIHRYKLKQQSYQKKLFKKESVA